MLSINKTRHLTIVRNTAFLRENATDVGFANDEPYDAVKGVEAGTKVTFDRSVVLGFISAGAEVTVHGNVGIRGDGVRSSVRITATKNILFAGNVDPSCHFMAGENIVVRDWIGSCSQMQAGGIVRIGYKGSSVTIVEHAPEMQIPANNNPLNHG